MNLLSQQIIDIPTYNEKYSHYSEDQRATWRFLVDRQNNSCEKYVSEVIKEGIIAVGINPHEICNIKLLSENLYEKTGWSLLAVNGELPSDIYLKLLSKRKFPVSVNLRHKDNVEFTDMPDFFHDIYGHIPVLFNSEIRNFLSEFGIMSVKYINNEKAVDFLKRIFWFIAETGLINENGIKILGASILTSSNEIKNVYENPKIILKPFNYVEMMNTFYDSTVLQDKYFVLDSYDQLIGIVGEIENKLQELIEA